MRPLRPRRRRLPHARTTRAQPLAGGRSRAGAQVTHRVTPGDVRLLLPGGDLQRGRDREMHLVDGGVVRALDRRVQEARRRLRWGVRGEEHRPHEHDGPVPLPHVLGEDGTREAARVVLRDKGVFAALVELQGGEPGAEPSLALAVRQGVEAGVGVTLRGEVEGRQGVVVGLGEGAVTHGGRLARAGEGGPDLGEVRHRVLRPRAGAGEGGGDGGGGKRLGEGPTGREPRDEHPAEGIARTRRVHGRNRIGREAVGASGVTVRLPSAPSVTVTACGPSSRRERAASSTSPPPPANAASSCSFTIR